jgi:hypothetical protein
MSDPKSQPDDDTKAEQLPDGSGPVDPDTGSGGDDDQFQG